MEVKINKEIRNYSENVYFGLSLRQFIFSLLACSVAIIIYFLFKNKLGKEITSWLCIIFVTPFIMVGFVKYNGMNLEELLKVFIRNKILTPKYLVYNPNNYYEELIKNKEVKGKYENIKKR